MTPAILVGLVVVAPVVAGVGIYFLCSGIDSLYLFAYSKTAAWNHKRKERRSELYKRKAQQAEFARQQQAEFARRSEEMDIYLTNKVRAQGFQTPVRYTKTMPCQHCAVGSARQIAANGNTELYECPECGGRSTMTHSTTWSFGFLFPW